MTTHDLNTRIYTVLDSTLGDIYKELGITSGDVAPDLNIAMSHHISILADIFSELIKANTPEKTYEVCMTSHSYAYIKARSQEEAEALAKRKCYGNEDIFGWDDEYIASVAVNELED